MPDIKIAELKTKNKKKDKVVVQPTQIPLTVEKEFRTNMRAYNNAFKKAVRAVIFPLIESYSKLTRDGIGDEIDNTLKQIGIQFNFTSIASQIANRMVTGVDNQNAKRTTRTINNSVGVDVENIIISENLTDFIEMQTINNAALIKNVPDQAIEDIRRIILNGFSQGLRASEITKQISGNIPSSVFNKMNNRINTIARTGVAQVNSQITNKRLLNLGITKAVWDATNDSRTRECHRVRDGEEYDIKKGLYSSCDGRTIQPGEEISCRCVARPIVE